MIERRTWLFYGLIALLGAFSLSVVLAFHNITDGDLWAKLAIGESVWKTGHILHHDVYAFTPTLPEYIDHECGAGVVFYDLLHCFGPASLIVLRMLLALGLLVTAAWTGWRQGCSMTVLLLLAVPAAASILTGYIPVVRSHAFTFFLFAVTLLCVEALRRGARWPAAALPLLTLAGTNLHGGFVIALGVVFFYCAVGFFERKNRVLLVFMPAACVGVTHWSIPYRITVLALLGSSFVASARADRGVPPAAVAGLGRFLGISRNVCCCGRCSGRGMAAGFARESSRCWSSWRGLP